MACTAIACIVMARGVLQCTLYVHVNAAHTLNILVITIISYNILVITRLIRLDTGAGVLIDMRADMCVGMCVWTDTRIGMCVDVCVDMCAICLAGSDVAVSGLESGDSDACLCTDRMLTPRCNVRAQA